MMDIKENDGHRSMGSFHNRYAEASHVFGVLFLFILLLAACPIWGQVNKGIIASMEGDDVLFEIHAGILGEPMMFVRHHDGFKQVRWSKERDHILLEIPKVKSLTGPFIPVDGNAKVSAKVIGRFPIVAGKGTTGPYTIKVTSLFLQDPVDWQFGGSGHVLLDRSFIVDVGHLPDETIVRTKLTVSDDGKVSTVDVDFSLYLLPEPMMPRLFDHRMGFLFENSSHNNESAPRTPVGPIVRWRLEKKNPDRALSDPVEPITYYLDPNIPDKWVPYIKKGVMEWLPAFEAAGFKNAIVVKKAPASIERLPNSVNHSVIRWSPSYGTRGYEDARGSSVRSITDFRTGEILKSDIIMNSSHQNQLDNYFVRCGPLDKRVLQYPVPDDLLGELMQSTVAHETGHTFGIRDSNFGEYAYPFEKMRDEEWLRDMGHTPSIMSYTRHNYVAQPEDSIPPSLLLQKRGPADTYHIKWGYMPIPGARAPAEELPFLEAIVREQDTVPWYRFNTNQYEILGPGSMNYVLDNDDPIGSTALGLRNMERVLELLPKVNAEQRDDAQLERRYDRLLTLWQYEMSHVISMIGGYAIQYRAGYQRGSIYTPIPRDGQERAMDFVLSHMVTPPDWLVEPKAISRIYYATTPDRLMDHQLRLLNELLRADRMKRLLKMEDSEAFNGMTRELVTKLQSKMFEELLTEGMSIDRRKQELQHAYIQLLGKAINQKKAYDAIFTDWDYYLYSDHTKAVFRYALQSLKKQLIGAMGSREEVTLAHIESCIVDIIVILEK
ncbi:zinc-dependent metalloprotease [Flagellimonas marina]|uniref:Zinc-dependent metalloprotease n=1 Tax=Flagellimonas marina TaxID=1775168 RepID=A0ABV8PJB8_9FLAO